MFVIFHDNLINLISWLLQCSYRQISLAFYFFLLNAEFTLVCFSPIQYGHFRGCSRVGWSIKNTPILSIKNTPILTWTTIEHFRTFFETFATYITFFNDIYTDM